MILITGGAGFVGRHLCAYLAARGGDRVRVLSRHPERVYDDARHTLAVASRTVERMGEESNNFWITAIDIEAFIPADEFRRDMDAFIEYQKSSQAARGSSQVIIPGERDFAEQRQRETEGIPIPHEIWSQIQELATELNVSPDG